MNALTNASRVQDIDMEPFEPSPLKFLELPAGKEWIADADIRELNFASRTRKCVYCGEKCSRHSRRTRRIKDVGQDRPVVLAVTVGRYWCARCERFFTSSISHLAPERGKYTHRVIEAALRLLENHDAKATRDLLRELSCIDIPLGTIYDLKSYAEYAKTGGIDPVSMERRDVFTKFQRIERIVTKAVSEDFDDTHIIREKEKKIKYDFPGRKGIIPEGALLVTSEDATHA